MGLGPLYTYSLQEARERARWARQLIGSQRDPLAEKRAAEAALTVSQLRALTFKQAALDFLATDRVEQFKNAKHRQQWRSTLALAFPVIGELPLQSIRLPRWCCKLCCQCGRKLPRLAEDCAAGSNESSHGRRLTSFLMARTRQTRDVLRDALPSRPKPEHHKAYPFKQLPAFMAELRNKRLHVSQGA